MSPRPYQSASIQELERLYVHENENIQKLNAIREELQHRRTKRAKSLSAKLIRRLAQHHGATRGEAHDGGDQDFLPLEEVEKRHLIRVLKATKNNTVKAAKILRIDRRTLYRMVERFGLDLGEDADARRV